jgi:hypothetical protein
MANTILVVIADQAVPWSKPEDLTYDPAKPIPSLGTRWPKPVELFCFTWSWKPGYYADFGDGKVRFISQETDEGTLRNLIIRNGNPVDASRLE